MVKGISYVGLNKKQIKIKNMAKLGDLKLKGCSGKEYSFQVYSLGTTFKVIGGVYYISKRTVTDNKGSHEKIYIGITDDFSTRFNNHHKANCFKNHNANCISVLVENNKSKREEIERDLLCTYDCPCNEKLN